MFSVRKDVVIQGSSATTQIKSEQIDEESGSGSHGCPYCNYVASSEMRLQGHVVAQHSAQQQLQQQQHQQHQHQHNLSPGESTHQQQHQQQSSPSSRDFLCPLCQDSFSERVQLERHVMQIHSVNSEGLQRLLSLVDQSHWLNKQQQQQQQPGHSPASSNASGLDASGSGGIADDAPDDSLTEDEVRCLGCSKTFRDTDSLAGHLEIRQTQAGAALVCCRCPQAFSSIVAQQAHSREIHGRNTPGIAVSEKHVYKYRCSQCSLAFKTMDKLQLHSQYHLIRDATKCVLCARSFRSVAALHKHVETTHTDLTEEEANAYRQSLLSNPLLLRLDPASAAAALKDDIPEDDDECAHSDDGQPPQPREQYIDDYLNSQPVAEENYNDPSRKYKCHRCKVAFTRQSYLTSHNKTLLHRKGEKLSYPMEKYLDPNRPYKCDVCKESFTQKNILLVHYNSVSHLHKLKRAMQEQHNNNNPTTPLQTTPTNAQQATTPQQQTSIPTTPTSSEDDDKKPYKCNICKVAYSQGSTLDIHMRSVLHQTRASKLQDLAMAGQLDFSRPLIEQPDTVTAAAARRGDSSTPPSPHTATAAPSPAPVSTTATTPTTPVSVTTNINCSNSTTNTISSNSTQSSNMLTCQRCNAHFANQEQLQTHQQLYCLFGSAIALFPGIDKAAAAENEALRIGGIPSKKSSQVYKHLLESFGFDLVMQFNENHQRRRREAEEAIMAAAAAAAAQPPPAALPEPEPEPPTTNNTEDDLLAGADLPELAKSVCQHCRKEFSSVWVLKAHCEEVHKDLVPPEFLEQYAQKIKSEYERKADGEKTDTPSTTTPTTSTPAKDAQLSNTLGEDISPLGKESAKTPPERPSTAPSTPTASSTPASSTSGQEVPSSSSSAMPTLAQHVNAEVQAAISAMAASQLQQQLQQLNPMMLGMAGLGMFNVNALAAMNLQPPLVPMMMPPPGFDHMGANALFQAQAAAAVAGSAAAAAAANDPQSALLAKQQQHLLQQQQQAVSSFIVITFLLL